MPKKKELLIILILAVLVAGLSWFYTSKPFALDALITKRGFPLAFWSHTMAGFDFGVDSLPSFPPRWHLFSIVVDLLFWFLFLAGSWWAYKKFRRSRGSR